MSRALELLAAQVAGQGCDLVTIRALVEEAAEAGARRALAKATPTRSAKTTQIGGAVPTGIRPRSIAMTTAQPGQEQRMEIEALTDAEAESAFFTLIGMFDKLGCAPGGTVEKKEDAGVSFRLHFNVERVRRLLAVTRPTADLGDDGELDAALLRARTNIQMGGNTLRIDSTDLQLFVRVLSRSGADNTRVKDQSHGG